MGLLGATLLALSLAFRSLRHARAAAGYHRASGGATPSPTFKGMYRPFLQPSRGEAPSWPGASVVVSHYNPPANQGVGGDPYGSGREVPPAVADATAGCEIAGETTAAAVSTVIHVPRAIRLVHPQLHASPPSSFLRLDSDEYVRM